MVPETFTDRQYSYSGEDELLKTRHSRRGNGLLLRPTGASRRVVRRMRVSGELAVRRGGKPAGEARGERATAENSVVPFNRLMSYRGGALPL